MINQQLIDFVQQSIRQGKPKEKIISELVNNGWAESDIEECSRAIDVELISTVTPHISNTNVVDQIEESHSGKKIIITIFVILIILGGVFIFRNKLFQVKDTNDITDKEPELQREYQKFGSRLSDEQQIPVTVPDSNVEINTVAQSEAPKLQVVNKPAPVVKSPAPVETKKAPTPTPKPTPVVTPVVTKPVVLATVVNCGVNMSCLQSKVSTCTPSYVTKTISLDTFGLNQTNIQKFSLTGFDANGKCGFSSETIDAKIDFSQESKDAPEFKLASVSEKNEVLIPANESVKKTIGMILSCTFLASDISILLADFEKNQTSTVSMNSENCSVSGGTFDEDIVLY